MDGAAVKHINPGRPLYLGMRDGDLAGKPYAGYWNPHLAPLPEHAREALLHGPVAAPLVPSLEDAGRLLDAGLSELENGFGFQEDGALHVAIRTELPGASPEMIDWWFGWHSEEPQRYKLWHPRAHVHAQWSAPSPGEPFPHVRARYQGRVSLVDEYIGSQLNHVAIQFLRPAELGFDERALADTREATLVCARIGLLDRPADAGYLVHHVRRVAGGSEMRSRFWLGGRYARVRGGLLMGELASRLARRILKPTLDNGRDLLVHCSQEMSHLASFLPQIYGAMRDVP
jgi:hypothetical protein